MKHVSMYKKILVAVSICIFFGYNFLNFGPRLFNSPDATANFVFIQNVADGIGIQLPHRTLYGEALSQYIHPRSTFANFGETVLPVGFVGLVVLYGLFAKITTAGSVVFITPLLAIAAAWALFGIWKYIFNERQAFYATCIYMLHPVVWYYSARSLLPNVPFVSILIIGTYVLVTRPFKKRYVNDVLGSLIAAVALLIRPNEIFWILPVAVLIVFSFRKNINKIQWAIWSGAGVLFVLAYMGLNAYLYGSTTGGYIISNSVESSQWYHAILPFGFHITNIVKSGFVYFVKMYWWLVLPALIGLLFIWSDYIRNKLSKELRVYVSAFLLGSTLLFIYYGSNIDISYELKTIGVAYSRYWLPIFIMSLPFILYGLDKISIPKTKMGTCMAHIYVAVVFFMGPQFAFAGIDGLYAVQQQIAYMQNVRFDVLGLTTERDIIVTDREDKFFWPTRDVMVRFRDPAIPQAIATALQDDFGVYYFTPTLSGDDQREIEGYIVDYGLKLEFVEEYPSHTLFRFLSQ